MGAVRIPKDLKWAYPADQDEVLGNLHTGNPLEAKARAYAVIARIKAEFKQRRLTRELSQVSLSPKRVETLTDEEQALMGGYYKRSVLQQDFSPSVSPRVLVTCIRICTPP